MYSSSQKNLFKNLSYRTMNVFVNLLLCKCISLIVESIASKEEWRKRGGGGGVGGNNMCD